jgi:hypothetical protein
MQVASATYPKGAAVKEAYKRNTIKIMAPGQIDFTYSANDLNALFVYLSAERMAMYMKAVAYAKDITDRTRKALRRYEYNTAMSEAFYPVIQGFEVALRNAVHNRLCTDNGADWLDTFALLVTEKGAIADAKSKITSKLQPMTQDRVVAELSFGFWVRLFSAEYAGTLWGPSLSRIVQVKDRRALYDRLIEVKTLRNRIAHHNRIVGRTHTIEETYVRLLDVLDWVSPLVCSWVMKTNSVMERVKRQTPLVPVAQRKVVDIQNSASTADPASAKAQTLSASKSSSGPALQAASALDVSS